VRCSSVRDAGGRCAELAERVLQIGVAQRDVLRVIGTLP
jgi:hypothetical protein